MSDDVTPQPEGIPEQEFNPFDIQPEARSEPLAPPPMPDASKSKKSLWSWLFGTPKSKREKKVRPTPAMPRGGLVKPITGMYTTIGTVVFMADQHCGNAIIESAQDCAEALDDLAKRNPKVRHALLLMLETSDVSKVLIAHGPIMMAVMSHHMPLPKKMVQETLSEAERVKNEGRA